MPQDYKYSTELGKFTQLCDEEIKKGHDYQVSVHKRQHSPAGKWNFPDFRGKHEINRNKIMGNTVFVIMCLKKYIYMYIYRLF